MRFFSRPKMMALNGVLLLLLIGGALFLRAHRRELRADMRSDLYTIARLKASEIESWLHERRADAAVLSEDAGLHEHISRYLADGDPQAKERIRRRFRSLKEHYGYLNILLAAPNGSIRLSLEETDMALGGNMVSILQAAIKQGRLHSIDLHAAEDGGHPHTSVIAPIVEKRMGYTRNLGAVVLISNAEDFLYPLVQQWPNDSESAESLLIRRAGDDVLFLNELRHRKDAALQFRLPLSRTELPAVKAVQGAKGWIEGRDYRGKKVLAVVRPIRNSPWFMVAKIDADEALSVLRRESVLIVALGIGLIALVWIGTVLIFQRQEANHYEELYRQETIQRQAIQRDSVILKSIGDAVIATDAEARVEMINAVAEELTGWTAAAAAGQPADTVFRIINEKTREPVESPITRVFRKGVVVGLANHTLLLTRKGEEVPIADSGAPIFGEDGRVTGAVLVFRDQTKEQYAWQRERHLREVLLGIRNVNQSIVKAENPTWLIERACEHFTQTFGYNTAWIALLNRAGTAMEQVAGAGLDERLNYLREHLSHGALPSCARKAIEQPDTVHVFRGKETAAETNCRECCVEDIRNGNSALVRALAFDNEVFGVLCVSVPPPFEADEEGLTLFDEVVQDMAFALHKMKVSDALRRTEHEYRQLFETAPAGIFRTHSTGKVLQVNPAMARMLGAESPEQVKTEYSDLANKLYVRPERRAEFLDILRRNGEVDNFKYEAKTLGGGTAWLEMIAHIVNRQEDGTFCIDGFVIDITQRKRAELERDQMYTQIAQTERMNAVGRLAGGVAHDFNNLLMGMMNYVELCRESVDGDSQMREWLDQVKTDAQRSADLTRQLLSFARKQTVAPQIVELNDAVSGILKMLRRLIGEDIELTWRPGADVNPVYIDPSQIDQILANLVVNARDAIGGVGQIIIETRNVQFNEGYCKDHPGFVEGDFAMLAISDDGCGMDEGTIDKVFEPFFTTKPTGEGTGLGLATVYGIVKQNDGFINVYSEPSKGTMFRIYLPRHQGAPAPTDKDKRPAETTGGNETILLVEDEMSVRKTTNIFLRRMGYTVIQAESPQQALELAEQTGEHIDLLITDVVMPGMSGRDLATRITEQFQDINCLYMSGYTADVIANRGILEKDVAFLGKPFTRDELAQKVREVLS